jgi:pimeloyl-ACP methyl ester carboxylesterase
MATRAAYAEKLVFTESEDGLPLEGAVIAPANSEPANIAVVWIHGGASNFYQRHYISIGRELAGRGFPFIPGNTRGHDGFALLWRGDEVVAGGGSFERFDESPHDVAPWIDVAMGLGARGVVLAGHSLGASKAVYYQAVQQDARVLGLIAASPVVQWPSNPERVALAEQMVQEGRGEELLPRAEGTPKWNIVSAQMVATRDQVIRHVFDSDVKEPDVAQILCPLLVLYGADEEDFDADWLETIRTNARSASRVDIQMIDGAGHEFSGQEGRVARLIQSWIESRVTDGSQLRT